MLCNIIILSDSVHFPLNFTLPLPLWEFHLYHYLLSLTHGSFINVDHNIKQDKLALSIAININETPTKILIIIIKI